MMDVKQRRDEIMAHYYEVEGGAVNHDDDLGGATGNGGVTRTLLEAHRDKWPMYGYTGESMDDIPYGLLMAIFKEEFWDPCRLDEVCVISDELAECIYGWGLNTGRAEPVRQLQRFLCVMNKKQSLYKDTAVDGGLGGHTLETLKHYLEAFKNKRGHEKLIKVMLAGQMTGYIVKSYERAGEKNETFTDGWLNRVLEKEDRVLEDFQ